MTKFIIASEQRGIVRWHIDRPERMNALGVTLASEFSKLSKALKKSLTTGGSNAPKALVISAASVKRGEKYIWIAGGDLKELNEIKNKVAVKSYATSLLGLCQFFESIAIPVIALIDGAAIGGGAELALAADIRIGLPQASFLFKQLEVGLPTGYGGGMRLIALVGKAQAQKLLYARKEIDSEEALAMGLLTHLIESESEVEDVLDSILKIEGTAFAAQKKMLNLANHSQKPNYQNKELALFLSAWRNPKHENFLNKFNE